MGRKNRGSTLIQNLPQLQNLIKRDPISYKDEFFRQWRHYESQLAIFQLKPESESEEFGELITFLSHVSNCYPKETAEFPQQIIDILSQHYMILSPDLRKTMVQALILLKNKDVVSTANLLSLFFTLFRCKDKLLRTLLHTYIVTDVKNSNAKHKNNKLNKTLQNFMFKMLNDSDDIAARESLKVMIDLYKKNIWNDEKTVNIIAQACLSKTQKIAATAVAFFLGVNNKEEEEDDEEDIDIGYMKRTMKITKKTKSKQAQMERALTTLKKKERQRNKAEVFNFSALHLINDPQGFTEKLFSRLKQVTSSSEFSFEVRVQMINLISRLIGVHKLILLNFYTFIIKYLVPHQRDVTQILAYTAQSIHDLIPPDSIEPIVEAISNNFLWTNCASEVIIVGLNSLREICTRAPLAMNERLLQSLVADFKIHQDSGVTAAAKSLVSLYREINPEMLKKKDRGKIATINLKDIKAPQYGEVKVNDTVEGMDLLMKYEKKKEEKENNENNDDEDPGEGWEGWEVDSEAEVFSDDDNENKEEETEEDKAKKERIKMEEKKKATEELTMRILTDEDFSKLKRLRHHEEIKRMTGNKDEDYISDSSEEDEDEEKEYLDADDLTVHIKRKKSDYAERIESIKRGREGREKFGSRKGKERSSVTNAEKAKKNKAFMMVVHKRSVQNKAKKSLREKQKILRAHIKKQKMKLK